MFYQMARAVKQMMREEVRQIQNIVRSDMTGAIQIVVFMRRTDMQELDIVIPGLFKIFFYAATLWAAYRIGKINGIEEAKRIWTRYSDDRFEEEQYEGIREDSGRIEKN